MILSKSKEGWLWIQTIGKILLDSKVRNEKKKNGNTATNTNSIIDANTYTFRKQIQAQSTRMAIWQKQEWQYGNIATNTNSIPNANT